MLHKLRFSRFAGTMLSANLVQIILIAVCAFCWAVVPASATDRTWTGAANGYWANANNWNPGQPPQTGDHLIFLNGASNMSMTNDMDNLSVAVLYFENADSEYQLSGNPLTVTGFQPSPGAFSALIDMSPDGGSGSAVVNCPLVFPQGGYVGVGEDVGVITEDNGHLYLNGPISLGIGTTLTLDTDAYHPTGEAGGHGELYIGGQISGSGTVIAETSRDGDGALVEFNGTQDSALNGALYVETIGDSHIIFNQPSGHAVTNMLAVSAGQTAKVQFSKPDQIGHNATISLQSGALLQLSGSDVETGGLLVQAHPGEGGAPTLDTGSVVLGVDSSIIGLSFDDSFSPTIKGKIKLNAQLPVTCTSSGPGLDIQAAIQGSPGFQKLGNGRLILSGANTFSGHVDVHEGILDVRNSGALGSTSGLTFLTGSGSLTLRNVTIAGEILSPLGDQTVVPGVAGSLLFTIGTCAWNGPIVLDTNLVVYADDTSLNGAISGSSGLALISGTATIGGTTANSFTGPLLARCDLLQLNKPSGTLAYGGPLVVGDTGIGGPYEARWLQPYQHVQGALTVYANGIVNLNNHNEDFGAVTFNGGEVDTGTGQFAIYQPLTVNASSATATINGNLGLPSGDARTFVVNDGAAEPDLLVNAVMFGSPTYFVKQGPGTMRLANANTFFATTLHEGGTLDVANASGLGNSGSGCVIFDAATLRLNTSGSIPNNFEATGFGTGATNGAFQVAGANTVTLTGSIQFDTNTLFNVPTAANLGLSGVLSGGSGALTKSGGGSLSLSGSGANTYSGLTTINSGLFVLGKSGGAAAVPGNLVLGPAPSTAAAVASFLSPNSIGGNTVTVNANSSLNLNGHVQTLSQLNLNDGGSVATGAGTLNLDGGATVSVGSLNLGTHPGSHVSSSITGNIGLPPNAFAVNFNVSPYSIVFPFDNRPELDVPANIFITAYEDPNFSPTKISKSGAGRMRLAGSSSYKSTTLTAGMLQVDGSQPSSGVLVSGGTLKGTGSVGPVVLASASSAVAPGDSPGILTCSNFNNGGGNGVFQVQLNGTTVGSGYSQLNVHGTVNLTGMSLNATLGYNSAVSDEFTIINNDGLDSITGTFKGLPAGAQFYIGGQLFQISYGSIGLGGNDVRLTRLVTPVPPVLTIEPIPTNSVRLLWPTNDPGFGLEATTNLGDTNWTSVSPAPALVGTNNVVTNAATLGQKFYRLSK